MEVKTLQDLLGQAASREGHHGIINYPLGNVQTPAMMTYVELQRCAVKNARLLSQLEGLKKGSIILLHLKDHAESIVWFWSVVMVGCIPAMSTPFSNDPKQRQRHISHLAVLLRDPLCLTKGEQLHDFGGAPPLRLKTIEDLTFPGTNTTPKVCKEDGIVAATSHQDQEAALLMLTSGSTGNAKAVILKAEQIIASLKGKLLVRSLPQDKPFLNWVGLDHVASMVETHLLALYFGVDQIHVQSADLIATPDLFLRLLDRHRVSRSFAPNFFLSNLRRAFEVERLACEKLDLSCLKSIVSGGEANSVETINALSKLLRSCGAPDSVISPAFGMTETCAGAIYNSKSPSYDLGAGLETASVGRCMPGIKMRISVASDTKMQYRKAKTYERGELEVAGPVVFQGYFDDQESTMDAFSSDGWFRTGDQAFVDEQENLHLVGRRREEIIINGVKYSPCEIEASLDDASIPGVCPSYIVCFSYRTRDFSTERICVVFLPLYEADDQEAHILACDLISRIVMLETSARPYVLPLDRCKLQKSTLGKFSRGKIRSAFESGEYQEYQRTNDEILRTRQDSQSVGPATRVEAMLLEEFEKNLNLPCHELGSQTQIFKTGITSIDLIKVARAIERRLDLQRQIPISLMLTSPTVQSLANSLQELSNVKDFDPVVTLQTHGPKTPLWLIHPGVGEVLVFLPLAQFFYDRPLHALRARGFNPGESYFTSISEAVHIYHTAMKRVQPVGPYALAGYSYGSMLAFEVAKVLEQNDDEVCFLGSLNLPPHIKTRMQQLDWTECLLNLAYFLDLITEQRALELSSILKHLSHAEALSRVIKEAHQERFVELSLTSNDLVNWVGVAFSLQSMAREYEPCGMVSLMDVFYCIPLAMVSGSKEEWLDKHMSRWDDYVSTKVRFHDVGGAHYTMIGTQHVSGFQKILKMALESRGL